MEHFKKYWWAYALGLIALVVLFVPKKYLTLNIFSAGAGSSDAAGASASGRQRTPCSESGDLCEPGQTAITQNGKCFCIGTAVKA